MFGVGKRKPATTPPNTEQTMPGHAGIAVAAGLLLVVPGVRAAELPRVEERPSETVAATPAWEQRLLRLFTDGVLRDEDRRDRIVSRWNGPVVISVHGDAARHFIRHVKAVAAELSDASGLALEVQETPVDRGDIMVFVTWRKNYWPSFVAPVDPSVREFTCIALPISTQGRITRSDVHVNAGSTGVETAEACLLEELLQSLGFFGEIRDDPATVLHDGIGYRHLGAVDRLLLRALYDRRLTAGMSGAAAIEAVRPIIAELLAAAATGDE